MTALAWLVPAALFLGALGLGAFLWSLRSGQFEDLDGAAYRALEDDPPEERPHAEDASDDDASANS
ncbi:MAG: cbb3-type cytochrome oxidase assembly protein CcoS [Pseudomonadota bacterium]